MGTEVQSLFNFDTNMCHLASDSGTESSSGITEPGELAQDLLRLLDQCEFFGACLRTGRQILIELFFEFISQ